MRVMAIDINPQLAVARRLGLARLESPGSLNQMIPEADFVISTVTLTPETRGLLNLSVFERMKPTAFVINISRGPIVNEDDLIMALNRGLIAGAGLDVLSQEPPGPDHPLLTNDRVVITPHTAGVTEQSFTALGRAVADNVARLKSGDSLKNVANL